MVAVLVVVPDTVQAASRLSYRDFSATRPRFWPAISRADAAHFHRDQAAAALAILVPEFHPRGHSCDTPTPSLIHNSSPRNVRM